MYDWLGFLPILSSMVTRYTGDRYFIVRITRDFVAGREGGKP
jgi:hypothetical protein